MHKNDRYFRAYFKCAGLCFLFLFFFALLSNRPTSSTVFAVDLLDEDESEEEEPEPTPEELFVAAVQNGEDYSMYTNLYFDEPVWLLDGCDVNGNGYSIYFSSDDDYDGFVICQGGSRSDPSVISNLSIVCASDSDCGNGIISGSDCTLECDSVEVQGFFQGLSSYGDTNLTGCNFSNNGNDGWVPHGATHSGQIKNCDFSYNGDWSAPNGIAQRFARTPSFTENPDYGSAGSGVSSWGGTYSFSDCRFENNENCGLVTQFNSAITIEDSLFLHNGSEDPDRISSGICVKKNANTVTLKSGTISNNTLDGVHIAGGTFAQTGGLISGNGRYGVYQNGTYEISGNAYVPASNPVFLAEAHAISLEGRLSHDDEVIATIDTDSEDRRLGRIVLNNTGVSNDAYLTKLNDHFALTFDQVFRKKDGEFRWIDGAAVRAGNDVNSPEDTMILSGLFTAIYEPGLTQEQLDLVPGFEIDEIPNKETFYWKEPHTFTGTSQDPVPLKQLLGIDGRISPFAIGGSMIPSGWTSSLRLDDEPITKEVTIPAERLADDFSFSALCDFRFDLLFSANEGTNRDAAPDYELYDFAAESHLPENDGPSHETAYTKIDQGKTTGYFRKFYDHTPSDKYRFDQNREAYVAFREQYAYEGWSKRMDCLYRDADLFVPGDLLSREALPYNEKLTWFLKELSEIYFAHPRTLTDEKVRITLYAVWDRFPEIQALDRYFLKSEALQGKITETELLKKASASDKEDGVLAKGSEFRLVDFDPQECLVSGDSGSLTARLGATDKAGNTALYDILVSVSSDSGATSRLPQTDPEGRILLDRVTHKGKLRTSPIYTRFISGDFFELGDKVFSDESQAMVSCRKGALEPFSVWYQDLGRRDKLRMALLSLESEQYDLRYSYTDQDILAAQQYIRSYGKNTLNETFRQDFATKFLRHGKRQ